MWIITAAHVINTLIFKFARKNSVESDADQVYESHNGKIRYLIKGEGKPLLLLHGIYQGASILEWKNSIEALSKKYKVYAVDLLGFGASEKPKMSYSAYLYVSLINSFIEDVIAEKVLVCANSHSAAFAVSAQSFKPENFEKLLLINPTGLGSTDVYSRPSDFYLKTIANMPIIGTFHYLMETSYIGLQFFLESECFSEDCEVNDETLEKMHYFAHKGGSNAKYPVASLWSRYLNVSSEAKLAKIDIPVYVIWGTDCITNSIKNTEILKEIRPDIEISKYEGAKLLPHIEEHERFEAECEKFFG